ncbi:MAG: hypothetical protein K0R63_1258 [Rickettsiales bacterium]|jgi:uncharacterized membrane protein (UPF0127 family)|nr:hypothetical protein [Rickettsiales bacterium]
MFRLIPGLLLLSLILVTTFWLLGKTPSSNSTAPELIHFDTEDVFLARQGKSPLRLHMELALSAKQQERGLQYRDELREDQGMLFLFTPSRIVNMWMADTPRPLDMLFLDRKGVIVYIVTDTVPFSRDIISSDIPVAAVLEVNAGYAQKHTIAPGDKLLYSGFSR